MKKIYLLLIFTQIAFAQPYEPVVLWDRSGAGEQSRYGVVSALGDQNQDGFNDFAVWALGWGPPGQESEEVIEFFHGGNPPSQTPYMTYRAHPEQDQQFYRFQTAGDLNGDGFIDWQIWRVPLSDPNQITFETYWGGINADTIPDFIFHGPWTSGDIWLYPAGDFNGDGFDDLYLYRWNNNGVDFGQIFYGGSPMDTFPDWTRHSPTSHPQEALPHSFGDLNGDGYSDFVSGDGQNTYIYIGNVNPDTLPLYTLENFSHSHEAIVLSLNADGYEDLVFSGFPQWTIHLGGPFISSTPTFTMNFVDNCSWTFAAGVGDINGDGYNDLALIDALRNCGCSIYLGHPWLNPDPNFTVEEQTPPLNLGGINNAAALGDVNGDGIDDFAIGAFDNTNDGFRGRCLILSGDTSLHVAIDNTHPELPQEISVSVFPNPFNLETAIHLETPLLSEPLILTIFNVLGQMVQKITLPHFSGEYTYHFNAQNLTSGIYLLHIQSGQIQNTHKLMLLK